MCSGRAFQGRRLSATFHSPCHPYVADEATPRYPSSPCHPLRFLLNGSEWQEMRGAPGLRDCRHVVDILLILAWACLIWQEDYPAGSGVEKRFADNPLKAIRKQARKTHQEHTSLWKLSMSGEIQGFERAPFGYF